MLALHEMPEHMRRAIASAEVARGASTTLLRNRIEKARASAQAA
jgi:hypothetical protein